MAFCHRLTALRCFVDGTSKPLPLTAPTQSKVLLSLCVPFSASSFGQWMLKGSVTWLSSEPTEGQATHLTELLFPLTGGPGTSDRSQVSGSCANWPARKAGLSGKSSFLRYLTLQPLEACCLPMYRGNEGGFFGRCKVLTLTDGTAL